MYCPECGAEYRDEILECADCRVALTASPPSEPSHDGEPMVGVFRSSDASLMPVLKSVLDAANIPVLIQGDEASGLFPFGKSSPVADGVGLGAVLLVPKSREDEAKALIESAAPLERVEQQEEPVE